MIEIIKFESLNKGNNLLVFGAVHGDEICGPKAIYEIIEKIKSNKIKINSGSVTFISICNPQAYKENKRFVDINLNRIFKENENPKNTEEKISQILLKYIDQCDYLLDIHSMSSDGPAFTFLDKTDKKTKDFISILNFPDAIMGWNELFGGEDNSSNGYGFRKNKTCATIECGNHNNSDSIIRAKTSILNSLSYLKITDTPIKLDYKNLNFINMEKIIYKNKEGKLLKYWNHLDKVAKGEILVEFDDGEKIIADKDYLIILPHNSNNIIGTEWFYLGNIIENI